MPEVSARLNTDKRRRIFGVLAIVLLACAMGTVIQAAGWAQTSNYALVRALADGKATVDEYSWESKDYSYTDGHYYSVKAPGMAFMLLPFHVTLQSAGANDLSKSIAINAREGGGLRWYRAGVPSGMYANNLDLALETRTRIEYYTPYVWILGLLACVIPAIVLMLIVRALGDQLAPGFGLPAAIAVGAGSMILPFSTLFFSHVLSAALAVGAFALLWRERAGPARPWLLAAAGFVAGFAITTEYPLGLAAIVLGLYGALRFGIERGRRGVAFKRGSTIAAGGLLGVLPLLAYNLWAFGSVRHFSYENAIAVQGQSGHDVLGLNDGGFFGITTPTFGNAFDLLFSAKGLFVATPILLLGLVGIVLMWRMGKRAEALTIGSIFAAYLVYNAGYWLPFGGGTPGPRFLIPVIPFLGIAMAPAIKRLPATAIALAVPSVLTMVAATVTLPMIGNGDVGIWWRGFELNNFQQTILSAFSVDNTWVGVLPFFLLIGLSLAAMVAATVPVKISRDVPLAVGAVVTWAVVAIVTANRPAAQSGQPNHAFEPVIAIALISALILVAAAAAAQRIGPSRRRSRENELATATN